MLETRRVQKYPKRIRSGGESVWDPDAQRRQSPSHFAERCVLSADDGDIVHSDIVEPPDICSHRIPPFVSDFARPAAIDQEGGAGPVSTNTRHWYGQQQAKCRDDRGRNAGELRSGLG